MGDRASRAGEGGWFEALLEWLLPGTGADEAYRRDVIERPVVGAAAGGVLGGFVLLLVWLTWAYAEGGDADQEIDGVYGLWTLAVVSLGALYAGWQPLVALARRRLTGGWVGQILAEVLEGQPGDRLPRVLRRLVEAPVSWAVTLAGVNLDPLLQRISPIEGEQARAEWPQRVVWFVLVPLFAIGRLAQLPLILVVDLAWALAWPVRLLGAVCGRIFSVIDFVLAQGVARLAGATLGEGVANRFLGGVLRYAVLLFWTIGGALVGWYAPAPFGAIAVVCGLLAVLGVARRWAWVETDRDAFMTARGAHEDMIRLGFKEDLRDEALTGLVLLFVLVPVGLRLVYGDGANFEIKDGSSGASFLHWLTFFGVELLKALPLVDWSEVYEVGNGSLIAPKNGTGRATVFLLRVSLDLLLLGSIINTLQAQAQRRADQISRLYRGSVDVVDPRLEEELLLDVANLVLSDLKDVWRPKSVIDLADVRGHQSFARVIGIVRERVDYFPKYNPHRLRDLLAPDHEGSRSGGASELVQVGALSVLIGQLIDQGTTDELLKVAKRLLDRPGLIGVLARHLLEWLGLDPSDEAAEAETKPSDHPSPPNSAGSAAGVFDRRVPKMKRLDGGTFWMGSPTTEIGRSYEESPRHRRAIEPFEIGVYPVTFDEYDAFCDDTGKKRPRTQWPRGRRPVINVSWFDAQSYLAWLEFISGQPGWRLPSEAEWEYACRAGSDTAYSFGDDASKLDEYAWYKNNSGGKTQPVGEWEEPNAFGLHDMHGNVWEWCQDSWNETYDGAANDVLAWLSSGDTTRAVLRGGSWNNDAAWLRSAQRFKALRTARNFTIGFRVARSI